MVVFSFNITCTRCVQITVFGIAFHFSSYNLAFYISTYYTLVERIFHYSQYLPVAGIIHIRLRLWLGIIVSFCDFFLYQIMFSHKTCIGRINSVISLCTTFLLTRANFNVNLSLYFILWNFDCTRY